MNDRKWDILRDIIGNAIEEHCYLLDESSCDVILTDNGLAVVTGAHDVYEIDICKL